MFWLAQPGCEKGQNDRLLCGLPALASYFGAQKMARFAWDPSPNDPWNHSGEVQMHIGDFYYLSSVA